MLKLRVISLHVEERKKKEMMLHKPFARRITSLYDAQRVGSIYWKRFDTLCHTLCEYNRWQAKNQKHAIDGNWWQAQNDNVIMFAIEWWKGKSK